MRDHAAARAFYLAALAPLGFDLCHESEELGAGFGVQGSEDFWVKAGEPSGPLHVAFAAPSREAVDGFHAAGLAAGGRDNGAPGLRPQYHDSYYAAYLLDPDGNNVEAVHHGREEEP